MRWILALVLLLFSSSWCLAQNGPLQVPNYAGYQPSTNPPYTSVSGEWYVNTISYPSYGTTSVATSYQWISEGISTGFVQWGTQCQIASSGSPTCSCFYEYSGIVIQVCTTGGPFPTAGGDHIIASGHCTDAPCTAATTQHWSVSVQDVTAGWTWTQTLTTNSSGTALDGVAYIMETALQGNGHPSSLAQWSGPAQFFNLLANGIDPLLSYTANTTLKLNNTGDTGGSAMPSTPVDWLGKGNFNVCWGTTAYPTCNPPTIAQGRRARVL
jgi:Peptidase A4 family